MIFKNGFIMLLLKINLDGRCDATRYDKIVHAYGHLAARTSELSTSTFHQRKNVVSE